MQKRAWRSSLRPKVSLLFLALTLLPLLIFGYFARLYSEQILVRLVERQLDQVAKDKASLLSGWLEERRTDMSMVAETSLVRSMEPALIEPYLDLIRGKFTVYRELVVVSADGARVAASPVDAAARSPAAGTLYQPRANLFISDITQVPDAGGSSFLIGMPVPGPDGDFIGTVYGRVGTEKIIHSLLTVSLGTTGECYLVDGEGRFLAHKEPHRILTENISQSESFRNIFNREDRADAYLDYRGVEVLGTSIQVGDTDWYIVVEQDRAEAFAAADKLQGLLYLAVLFCIVSALALTVVISTHIIAPIRRLSRYAERIVDSRFDEPVVTSGRSDEIGTLYEAVTDMATRLRQRHLVLEEQVGQREAELKETDLMLRETLVLAERAEKFAAMGRMGAAIAHEIRTPLTSIKLFLESAQADLAISPEFEEDFTIAMNQIGRIEATINRFLDFSKPQDLVFSDIDVKHLLADLLTMVRPQINRQECVLRSSIEENLPLIVGDRRVLAEALINLLVNALDAMSAQGTLSVSAQRDRLVSDGREVACVRIDIGDTGEGITEDQVPRIFEPFFTTKPTGTGLGLPLVLNTVRNHGGDIRVASTCGQGTVFSLFFPEKASAPSPVE